MSRITKSKEIKKNQLVATKKRAKERTLRDGEGTGTRYMVSSGDDKSILELESGDHYISV